MNTKGKDGGGGGRNWETGIDTYTLWILYVKQITNENTGLPAGSVVKKKSACNGGDADVGLILGLGRSPGGGNGNPLQYSCLENPMDRGA